MTDKQEGKSGANKLLSIALGIALTLIATLAIALHQRATDQLGDHDVRIRQLESQAKAEAAWRENVTESLKEIKFDLKEIKK